ncbi:MAG: hypothetical protein WCS96_04865 [Victivallales bacterium]|jgi:hypothetical protein
MKIKLGHAKLFRVKFAAGLVAAFLFAFGFPADCEAAERTGGFGGNNLANQIELLSSPSEESVTGAIRRISEAGENAIPSIVAAVRTADFKARMNIVRTLAKIKGDKALRATADIMCNETNPNAIVTMGEIIRRQRPEIARRCFVPIATDPSNNPQRRAAAAFYIRLVGDKKCVDALLEILEFNMVKGKTTNAGLDLNVSRTEHVGDTDYSSSIQIRNNATGKSITVPNRITMPVISTVQLKTKLVVTAMTTLEIVTGQGFGYDITRWKEWWKKNNGSFGVDGNFISERIPQ